jgi:type IV pilus assembly protein PilY1
VVRNVATGRASGRQWLEDESTYRNDESLTAGWSNVNPPPTAQQVLDYLRGDSSHDENHVDVAAVPSAFRARSHVLGDIVYSAAVPVGSTWDASAAAPVRPYDDAGNPGYRKFAETKKARTPMVYVGANDGMLHAFVDSAGNVAGPNDGKEAWAYIPKALFEASAPNDSNHPRTSERDLAALTYRSDILPTFKHRFYVNATPRVWDIDFANTNTSIPSADNSGTTWRTILVGGIGAGGRSVYALDVTDPIAPPPPFLSRDTEATAASKVLWEFTDKDHPLDLGYVFDAPTLVKTYRYGWVVLVASGYNNPSGKGILYVLNPTNGAILKRLSPDEPADLDPLSERPDPATATNPRGLSTIRAYTASRKNPYVLQAYGGDLSGNVWRFDLSDPDESKWRVALIAKLTVGGVAQPITTGVRVEIDQTNNVDRYLFVGTGKLLDQADVSGWHPDTGRSGAREALFSC